MELSEYPDLSGLFKREVHQKYIECGGDPDTALDLADSFLDRYPYYPEALIFKARMLMVKDNYPEALSYLEAAKKIDVWRVNYSFDEAEILCRFGRKRDAAQCIQSAVEFMLREMTEGVENFLTGIDFVSEEEEEAACNIVREQMIRFLSGNSASVDLERIFSILDKHVML